MSAPRANKEDKKKRLGSRRSKAKQSEPHEADEINFMGSASVVEEEHTELPHVSNRDKSETETQHQPLSERTEKRRKLGSSRISKGRQNVNDPETASSYKAREVDEKPTGDEGLETTRVSWETQSEKQEDFSQREHETSAAQSSPLCSVSMSHDSEFDYVDQREDVSQIVISRSENLKANENECTVESDSDKLVKTVLKETHTTVTLSEKVGEHTQPNDVSETGLSVRSSTDQELIYPSNMEKMPKEEQSEVYSTTDRENTERCEDTDALLLDGNFLSTNLMSESHTRVLEVCATAEITDQTEVLPADEAQTEASSQDPVGEVAKGVNRTETFEIAEETLLIQTAVPVKRVESWPSTSDTVRLPGVYELNSSHMSPQVNQQPTGPPGVEEMPDECSVIETERDDTDLLGQQAISQASSCESSSVTREITIERSRSGEHVEPECSVEQIAASGKELSANEEQNENFKLTDIMENIYVSSGNLKTQAEFEDTQQSELHVKSFDNSGTSQEGSNLLCEFLTEEKIFFPLEHISKDYDSRKPHTTSPERRDTELSQVYEAEGQPEENIKSTAEQTSHQQKEGLFYKDEESKYLQNLEPQIHFTSTSQPQENLMSTEELMPDFNPVGSRRKLGSRRMNKGHQRDRDSPAESYHENGEDNMGHNRSNETTKDTLALQTMKQEETSQETVHDIMSVTDDSSLYSVFVEGDRSQVQNPTTCSQAALIEASENLQEANDENEADFEVEALNESLEDLSAGMATADSPQSKDHYARERSVNTQTKEDQEHVDSHVYETKEVQTTDIQEPDDTGLFQLTEEDKEPTAAQTGHWGKRELWSPEVHTQPEGSTEEVRLSSPIEELSKSQEQNVHLCEAGGAQPSDDAVRKVHEQDVKQRNKQMHVVQEATENPVFSVKHTHQAKSMDTHQSNMEQQGRNTGADTALSEESVESQGQAETQDNTYSISEQETTDFRLMGNKRKVGSRRKNKGQQQVKDVETATTLEKEIQKTSLETRLEETDTPQTKDDRDQGDEEDAHTGTGVQSKVTDDEQVMDQSGFTKVHADECLSSVTHTESNERDRDTDWLKQRETLQTDSSESELKPEGSESSVTLDRTTEESTFEEETGPEGRVGQAALSSPKKEQNESLVTEHTHTAQGQDIDYISVGENGSSVQSQSGLHGPADTGFKSAEHRRKLGSSRRTKGKQHGLDSAAETDLKLKEDAGNTWADEEMSLTTDTMRQEDLKQQTEPGVNASEQLRRNRNEGETTRKIRKEETTSPHNVMEPSVTETTDVTSRSDKDDALHKHTDVCDDPTKNEQMKDSEAVETTRSAASQRTGKEELSEESVDDITMSVTHDGSLCPASSPGLSADVQTHDSTTTGLEGLIHEGDSFQEEHEKRERCVESVGATLEDMEQSDCFGGKEAASSDGSTTRQDDSNSDTKHDSLTQENITSVFDQTSQDHQVSDEVNPQTRDAGSTRNGSALTNKSESQDEGDIKPPAEQTSHVEKEEGTPSPAQESTSSFHSLQAEIHGSVEAQTQDNSLSVREQNNKDFKSMGSRRKLGSSRRNPGKERGKNPESSQRPTAEARNTVGCDQAEASVGTKQDAPQPEDTRVDMSEVASISIQPSSTLDQQLINQSNPMMQIHNEEHSHVSVSDAESLKVEEAEGRDSSVTLENSRDKTYTGEETEHDGLIEQATLSSSQKEMSTNEEQSERFHESEVIVAQHMDAAAGKVHEEELKIEETQGMDPADHSRSSARSQSGLHAPADSQPEAISHTGSKSAEHRRKLGSSRRTKGKQHGLDSAAETDLKLKEDAGNTWADEEMSLTTDTMRQEDLKQQTEPGVNASEQLRRNRNEGETTRKIRKEETTSPHNVMEPSVTETTDVTSRSDKDDALHKHTDVCDDPTKNEQMKDSEAVETTRSAASQRTGKEELSEESVDDITMSVTHDGSLCPASSPGLSADVQTHDSTTTGLEGLIHEGDSFQEEHEKRERCVESVGATLEDMEQSDCFGGKEAASSDGSTTRQDDSNSDTKHDSLTQENITSVFDQTSQDHQVSDEVNPQTRDAGSTRNGSALTNKSESQDEGDIKPPAEQTSHVEKEEGTPSPAQESTSSFHSLQAEIHGSVEAQTQDNSLSVREQNNKDFKSMGSRRKLGSSRRNPGKERGKNPESSQRPTAEARNTVGCDQAEASVGTKQDAPQPEDTRVDMSEVASISIQPSSTLDQQLINQSNPMMQIHNEEHSHVSVSDAESLKVEEAEGRDSSVTLENSRDKTYTGEETEHDGLIEQATLSSSQKEMSTNEEQSERFHESEVIVAQHMDAAAGKVHEEELKIEETQGMDPADHSRSSARSQSGLHAPADSQPEAISHTGSKSAEHRRKLGSSRRTKGKQHGLDSAAETDLKLKEDAGNTWADEEMSLTTDTMRQEDLKQQTEPGVNASEQLRRNRNEGETTRKIRKEETTSPHHVMEPSVTETTDVTSRSDKDDALHKHTDESENLTLLTGKRDSLEDVEKLMVTEKRQPQPSLSNQLLQARTEDAVKPETARSTTKDEQGPEAMKSADVPGVTVHESNDVNEGANNTHFDMRNASPSFTSTNRRRKMGSTRRNLGSPSKQDPSNQKQNIPETAGGGLGEDASGTTWLQPQEQHQESEENGGVEHSSISESQFEAVLHQTAARNPDSPSLLEETRPQVNQDHLATKPSTPPEQDVTPESSNGGRRRKFGSNRKSRGNHEDQTAREDRIIAAPTDGGPTEERTKNGEGGEESVVVDKQQTSNIQNNESDKKLSPNVSSAAESWTPGSEKGKQVAPHVGINLSHKSFSLAGDSTEADVRSGGFNVLMVGDTGVGKTSFMKRAQSGKFSLDLPSSVGLDSCMWTVVVDGKRVVLHLWDTAGQERFHSITRQIFHKAQAFLLMYDVTSSKSFSAVSYWANCIQEGAAENVSVLLIGNKSDRAERQVQTQDGGCLAKEYNFDFMECSAATGQNVIECLETIARTLTQRADTWQEAVALKQEPQPKKRSGCC